MNKILLISLIILLMLGSFVYFIFFPARSVIHAIYNNDLGTLKAIIENCSNLNSPVDDAYQYEIYKNKDFPFFKIRKIDISNISRIPLVLACINYRRKVYDGTEHNKTSLEIIELLLNNGADPNIKDSLMQFPLPPLYEVEFHSHAMRLLINEGANVDFKVDDNPESYEPWYLNEFIEYITSSYCKLTNKEKYQLFKLVINSSNLLKDKDGPGANILYTLFFNLENDNTYYDMFEYCVKNRKINPNLPLKGDGRTILHNFAESLNNRYKNLIKLLIDSGADINYLWNFDGTSKTPLDLMYLEDVDNESIKFMRQLGAKTAKELEAAKPNSPQLQE
jgi:hypothetical protein